MLLIIRKQVNLQIALALPPALKPSKDAPAVLATNGSKKSFKIIVFIILCGRIIFMLLS